MMKLSQEEKQEIAQVVVDILDKRSKTKINCNWLVLRKEIEGYCQETNSSIRWPTLQSKIYDAIRAVLDISRVDEMTDKQVIEARRVFDFIKQEREIKND